MCLLLVSNKKKTKSTPMQIFVYDFSVHIPYARLDTKYENFDKQTMSNKKFCIERKKVK